MPDLAELAAVLGHAFADEELLTRALRHASWCNEHAPPRPPDNQRLELLGDAVLALAIRHRLFERFPDAQEGDLTFMTQELAREGTLAAVAREIDLGAHLLLGRGLAGSDGGRDRASILADALEAVIGAVFLDGGYAAAAAVVERVLGARLATAEPRAARDFKTRLMQHAQAGGLPPPTYKLVETRGPAHAPEFVVAAMVGDAEWGRGTGGSQQQAQQRAAEDALAETERSPERRNGGPESAK